MGLSFRHGRVDDIPRWLELASTGSREMYDAAALAVLPEVWRTWVSEGRCEIHCLVDDSRPVAEQVQGVVSGVFVTDAFADGLVAQPSSSLAAEVVRREASGRSVVLKPAEVAAANSNGGVNGLGIDFAFAGGWSALTLIRWTRVLFESVREWGYGWRVRTALREWIGQDTMLMARATGWPVLRDFSRGLKKKPPLLRRRYFSAYTLQDYRAAPTRLPAALFFDYQEPRFRFTPAEQQLLVLAVRGLTDAEAAEVLDLSPHTVKARWKAIFEQVAEQRPEWFPHRDDAALSSTRGVEKRRHLLGWLKQHMQELRPLAR